MNRFEKERKHSLLSLPCSGLHLDHTNVIKRLRNLSVRLNVPQFPSLTARRADHHSILRTLFLKHRNRHIHQPTVATCQETCSISRHKFLPSPFPTHFRRIVVQVESQHDDLAQIVID